MMHSLTTSLTEIGWGLCALAIVFGGILSLDVYVIRRLWP